MKQVKQISKTAKLKMIKKIIELVKWYRDNSPSAKIGLCWCIARHFRVDTYAFRRGTLKSFKELHGVMIYQSRLPKNNRPFDYDGYFRFNNWWEGRIELLERVQRKVEKL